MDGSRPLSPELLLAHAGWVKRLAARIVLDATSAEDVAQQAWLAAIESGPRDARNLRGWFASVLRRIARRTRLGDSRRRERERAVAAREAIAPTDELVARARVQRAVVDAVLALDEPYRGSILLRFFEELPPREIAARLGVPVETVRTRLKRASQLLRERLEREVDVPAPTGERRSGLGALVFMLEPASRAPVAPPPNELTAGATQAGLAGGLLMTTTSKLAVAALVVVAVTGTIAIATRPDPRTPSTTLQARTEPAIAEPNAANAVAAASTAPAAVERTRIEARFGVEPAATVVAPARRTIAGIVRDADGRAVADAIVGVELTSRGALATAAALCGSAHLLVDDSRRDRRQQHGDWECRRTDADGRFEVPLPDASSVNLGALHPELGLVVRPGFMLHQDVPVTQVELVLVPGLILTGRVTDDHGEPIAGASLMIVGPSGALADAESDADGRYRTLPLSERKLRVAAWHDGFVGNLGVDVVADAVARIHELDFRLARAEYLRGRVLGPDGKPLCVEGGSRLRVDGTVLEVEVLGSKHDPRGSTDDWHAGAFRGTIGPDGTWTLQLSGNDLHWVGVLHADRVLDVHPIVEGAPGPDLVFDPGAILANIRRKGLELHVNDEGGRAVLGYAAELRAIGTTLPSGAIPTWNDRTVVDVAGVWRVTDLLVGSWWLDVSKDGFVPATVEVSLGGYDAATTRVDLTLRKAQFTLRGRVVDGRGAPVSAADVVVHFLEGTPPYLDATSPTATDAEGRFELRGLPDAELALVARPARLARSGSGPRLAPAAIVVDPATATEAIELRLEDATTVRLHPESGRRDVHGPYAFRVRNEAGLLLRDDTGPLRWIKGFASNGFELLLAPGRYSVDVLSSATLPKTTELTVTNSPFGSIVRVEVTPRD